ncbi:4-hydroxy-tetrahydrodipicolinate reductase [Rubrobacter xylanophilus DSM 9941]|uniref:4-hydroxy-tetrahydrodipicolinate reductase n=1 Tax=Rubrobacter xylanophilus TaxID=49319 RepID=UPI001C643E2E|nr:4-hydroxy-tetrahydrodipicolinate reductase [Rubrobacter xylanophilus]QYJ16315.1 4-hydroxy-tetrahydrodipicolinate reductase [Rubrobacter xylanophilus DSM 9941]
MIRVTVVGAAGRMGREVCRAALEDPELELAGGVVEPGSPDVGADLGELCGAGRIGLAASEEPPEDAGVLVEFTTPEATVEHLAYRLPAVIGTTGLSEEQRARVEEAARSVPIVLAPNMSAGVNLLLGAVRELAEKLAGYDVEIVEAHHRGKRDAPSGTALLLGRAAASGRGQRLEDVAVYGREGVSPRREGEIGIHALRGGAVVGEHRVIFYGAGEEVEVVHRALSRRTFAEGALRAARFAAAAKPGLYTMQDVLSSGG